MYIQHEQQGHLCKITSLDMMCTLKISCAIHIFKQAQGI